MCAKDAVRQQHAGFSSFFFFSRCSLDISWPRSILRWEVEDVGVAAGREVKMAEHEHLTFYLTSSRFYALFLLSERHPFHALFARMAALFPSPHPSLPSFLYSCT